jgi:hypothetical protein
LGASNKNLTPANQIVTLIFGLTVNVIQSLHSSRNLL